MAVLDTSFMIDLITEAKRRRPGPATAELERIIVRGERLRVAIFTLAELLVGVTKGEQPMRERKAIERCLSPFEILPFERTTAEIFGRIVGELERRGISISDMDALIASVALEHAETVVTRNLKHFARIPGLNAVAY